MASRLLRSNDRTIFRPPINLIFKTKRNYLTPSPITFLRTTLSRQITVINRDHRDSATNTDNSGKQGSEALSPEYNNKLPVHYSTKNGDLYILKSES